MRGQRLRALEIRAVDFCRLINLLALANAAVSATAICVWLGTPLPLGSSGIIGLAGKSRQNPDSKRLRGQNLDNKGFRADVVVAG